jgi:hypothetical protein
VSLGLRALHRGADRRFASAVLGSVVTAALLTVLGSFCPVLVKMQPVRFVIPLCVLCLPAVAALFAAAGERVRPRLVAAGLAVLLPVALVARRPPPADLGREAVEMDRGSIGTSMGFGFPDPIPPAADFVWLLDLIRRDTAPDERLLVQTRYRCEPLTIPLATGRETIGCSFPDRADPVQFTRGSLFGRRLSDWTAFQLNETVRRWGVSYAVTCTPPTEALFQDAFGAPCATNGAYHAFRTGVAADRFLLGSGRTVATVNRIELSGLQPADGKVIPWHMLRAGWPQGGNRARLSVRLAIRQRAVRY